MRIIPLLIALLMPSTFLFAQGEVIEISLPIQTSQKAILNLKFAEKIEVKSWNKKELFIRAHIDINHGLMNEAHEVDTVITDQAIRISTGFDEDILEKSAFNNCDGKNKTQYRRGSRGYSICHTINYEVFLPPDTDVEIETISGDIAIADMQNEVIAESVSGTVDVTITKNQKADILLETVSGRAYTDPPMLPVEENGMRLLLSRKISNQLNGGGKPVHLKSVSGNVNLRYPDK